MPPLKSRKTLCVDAQTAPRHIIVSAAPQKYKEEVDDRAGGCD